MITSIVWYLTIVFETINIVIKKFNLLQILQKLNNAMFLGYTYTHSFQLPCGVVEIDSIHRATGSNIARCYFLRIHDCLKPKTLVSKPLDTTLGHHPTNIDLH